VTEVPQYSQAVPHSDDRVLPSDRSIIPVTVRSMEFQKRPGFAALPLRGTKILKSESRFLRRNAPYSPIE
jgi:hypothetical protein